jgi:RND superfamily putative drug exporter
VFLDATLVRMVLVPATMSLLGRANWWLPTWMERILPHIDFESAPTAADVVEIEEQDEDEDKRERELVAV